MKNLGKKPGCCEPIKAPSKDEKYYPGIYLSSTEAPFLKDCKVGDEETLVIKVKIKSVSERLSGNDKKSDYSLDIVEMGKPEK